MLADFTIHIHELRKPMAVQVKVHDSAVALRSATTQYSRRTMSEKQKRVWPTAAEEELLGVCHRFHMDSDPVVALVRLAPPDIGIGIVSHELAHAAVWVHHIQHEFKEGIVCENDELFCWVLGELVSKTVAKLYEKGIYS